jgi:hypothetical protein
MIAIIGVFGYVDSSFSKVFASRARVLLPNSFSHIERVYFESMALGMSDDALDLLKSGLMCEEIFALSKDGVQIINNYTLILLGQRGTNQVCFRIEETRLDFSSSNLSSDSTIHIR